MNKQALFKDIKSAVITLLVIVTVLLVFVGPLGNLFAKIFNFLGLEETCDETGKTTNEYVKDINEKFSQGNDKETIDILKEFHSCFPGEEFNDILKSKIEKRAEQKKYNVAVNYIDLARELDPGFKVSDEIKDLFPSRYHSKLTSS